MLRYIIGALTTILIPAIALSQQVGQNAEIARVLRVEPSDVKSQNLYYGSGGEVGQPNENDIFEFVIEPNGSKVLKDSSARLWEVRSGPSAQAELVAQRILWSMGYFVDEGYITHEIRVKDKPLGEVCLHHIGVGQSNLGNWSWETNPFVGKTELSGLEILLIMLGNWDPADSNNQVVRDQTNKQESYYILRIEKSLGRTGNITTRSVAKPKDYKKEKFIEKVEGNFVYLHYAGENPHFPTRFQVQDVKWISHLLEQLSPAQLSDAVRAGGFSSKDQDAYVQGLQRRIGELSEIKSAE